MATAKKRAVVLVSGGLDSAVTAAMAREHGFVVHALTIAYGQRHAVEVEAARRVARSLNVADHVCQALDLRLWGGSALTDDIPVPKDRALGESRQIPDTYVPARNTIFLSIALGYAEVVGSRDLFIGVNAVDYSGYPDCRPAFLSAFETLANVGTKAGVEGDIWKVHAPLLHLSKADIVREGRRCGVDFSLTHSCYDPQPSGAACGRCDSCRIRLAGFAEAGAVDPLRYVTV